jgi:hypothetical protein
LLVLGIRHLIRHAARCVPLRIGDRGSERHGRRRTAPSTKPDPGRDRLSPRARHRTKPRSFLRARRLQRIPAPCPLLGVRTRLDTIEARTFLEFDGYGNVVERTVYSIQRAKGRAVRRDPPPGWIFADFTRRVPGRSPPRRRRACTWARSGRWLTRAEWAAQKPQNARLGFAIYAPSAREQSRLYGRRRGRTPCPAGLSRNSIPAASGGCRIRRRVLVPSQAPPCLRPRPGRQCVQTYRPPSPRRIPTSSASREQL